MRAKVQPTIKTKTTTITTGAVSRWAMLAAVGAVLSGCSSMPNFSNIPNPINAMSDFSGKVGNFLPTWGSDTKKVAATPVTDPVALVRQGDIQRDGGDLDAAVHSYTKAVASNPTSLTATLRLAQTLIAQKRYDEGYAAYKAAQNLAPQDPEIAFRIGELELTHGQTAAALDQFKLALATRKDDPKLYNATGVAYATLGQHELALQNYKQGLAINPDYPALRNNYGLLQLATGDLNDAVVTFEKLVQTAPSDRYRINLAMVLTALGRTDDAQKTAKGLMDEAELKTALSAYYHPAVAPIAAATPAPTGGKTATKGKKVAVKTPTPTPAPQIEPTVTAAASVPPSVHFGDAGSDRGPTLWTAATTQPTATGKPIAVLTPAPSEPPAAPSLTPSPTPAPALALAPPPAPTRKTHVIATQESVEPTPALPVVSLQHDETGN